MPRPTPEEKNQPSGSPPGKPPGTSGHIWPKRFLQPLAFFLRTGNPTDTVDRLFDSQHVNDLRLIAATGFLLTLLAFAVALITALSFCLDAWPPKNGTTLPSLIVFLAQFAGVHFLTFFAPVLTIFGGILAWAYQTGSARLGVVDLFACEIDTLTRVVTVIDMVGNLVDRDNHSPTPVQTTTDNPSTSSDPFNSQENYFPILDSNARDLQTLEATVVINITAFYTYMKAMRDTFRRFTEASSHGRQHELLTNLIYMLYLALESGRKATDDLVEFEPIHTERTLTGLLAELEAYTFLRGQYQTPGEVRHDRLILRGPEYSAVVKKLNELLRYQAQILLRADPAAQGIDSPSYEDAQWWSAALQSLPALNARFEKLRSAFPLDSPL